MARIINPFQLEGVCGEDSSLSVSYRFRGVNAGRTDFQITRDKGQSFSFLLNSKEDAINLANYLLNEVNYQLREQDAPSFETTGYGLKIMSDNRVIRTMYHPGVFDNGVDKFNYNLIRKSFPEYKFDDDANDLYFIVFGLKDKGMSRDTLEKIIEACVNYQASVLISGDLRVFKLMTQLDIAAITGLDNATVSRASKDVHIFTAHRNYSLDTQGKTLSLDFSSLYNEGLNGISTIGMKLKIRSLIECEDKTNPLTDDEIVAELARFGYHLARLTVMKYWGDYLGIANSNQRKVRSI